MILLVHNRYRWHGGEERAVGDLAWLIGSELGEEVELLERDSAELGARAAARGLLTGGLNPDEVGEAVRRTGARVAHFHNVHPTFGWRALAAAREAGARVVLHLHNYRLVCAPGTCFTKGHDCVRCHGRWTLPGVRLNCRDSSRAEAVVYAAGISAQQRRIGANVDRFVVPSAFALGRLRQLKAPVGDRATVLPSVQRTFAPSSAAASGTYVLYAGRLAREKGVLDAVEACRRAGLELVVAGDGPLDVPPSPGVRLRGRVGAEELAELRAGAAVAVVPSLYAEILPLAALESMAAGLPTVAYDSGGLGEAVPAEGLAPTGDVGALSARLQALYADGAAGERALSRAKENWSPRVIAARLREIYG